MTSHASSVTTSRTSSEPYHQPEQSQEPDTEPEFIYGHMPADGDIDVEELDGYCEGGFHPVQLGDLLGRGGRFRVVHKLGTGGFGTVWLCHDKLARKWRAVKITTAKHSTPDCSELDTAELLHDAGVDVAQMASHQHTGPARVLLAPRPQRPPPVLAPPEVYFPSQPVGFAYDVWALGCSMMEVRLGNRPFCGYDLDNTSISALQNMELTMGPMPLAFRRDLKKYGFGSANCPHGAGCGNEGCWGDELVPYTIRTKDAVKRRHGYTEGFPWTYDKVEDKARLQEYRAETKRKTGVQESSDYLKDSMRRGCSIKLDPYAFDDIKSVYHSRDSDSNSDGCLPACKLDRPSFPDNLTAARNFIHYRAPFPEIDELHDLRLKIFCWKPEERATTGEIQRHGWFNTRHDGE
ncbi:hypothetical protein B0T26DRAFT_757493 [Lasiosphaeria miniovina]|uniref:Protein kinase domain-containing protein n=1 Tax=Lasiosphaeria miniovina TaxID=1954250 RepID=A0AA39ZUL7_9PEZI|nr:uncharacterized protein B0T26DRAFT_757493 [Lasiosphaeria miniovina]KAK0703997.1 hypothetical protein B0T26DRAFT_757493 [Lasiosphaeria miniovina]